MSNNKVVGEWEKSFIKNGGNPDYFAYDGLMFRGKLIEEKSSDGESRLRISQDVKQENKLWNETPLRVLYVLKDQNAAGKEAWDVRGECYHKPDTAEEDYVPWRKYAFHRNILSTIYGFFKTTPSSYIPYEEIDYSEALRISDKEPYARVNCKKKAGSASISDSILKWSIDGYSKLLKAQILNLDADIIVCCGYNDSTDKNMILDFVKDEVYPNLGGGYNNGVFFDKTNNKITIDAYHLSSRHSGSDYYEDVIVKSYFAFIKEHPEFIKSHRNNSLDIRQIKH